MGKQGKELTIADKQTIISMIEGGIRARKVAEINWSQSEGHGNFPKLLNLTEDNLYKISRMDSMLPMFNHVQPEQFREICLLWVIIGDPSVKQLLSVRSTEKKDGLV